jgi:NADP-dependent 3-hydroxy acid dehydrogenase YdfG
MTNNAPVVVVTGVGPGTGAAIARRFSMGGNKVAMPARTSERLAALERELPNANVTDETQLDATIEAVRRDLSTPTVLIHNAVAGSCRR